MILSDREIRAALARSALRITHDPPAEAWSSTALDLRLAKDLLIWKAPSMGGVETPERGYQGKFSIQGPTVP